MTENNKSFEAEKTFGLGVLLKLTQKSLKGIDISTTGNKFTSSLSREEMNDAVSRIMQTHNIRLKIK